MSEGGALGILPGICDGESAMVAANKEEGEKMVPFSFMLFFYAVRRRERNR